MTDWADIGALADIPRLGACVVHAGGEKIAVFRTDDDQVFALVDKCPHKGGPLSQGIVHGCKVTCPLHNFVIDLKSGGAVAPDEGHARTVPARLNGDRIEIRISEAGLKAVRETEMA